jgi:hypothetical protein
MATSSEQKTAAASTLLEFYNQVMTLLSHKAAYKSILAELQSKYGDDSKLMQSMDDMEKQQLAKHLSQLRYTIDIARTMYYAIAKNLKQLDEKKFIKEVQPLLDNIDKNYICARADVEAFAQEMYGFLLNDVVQNLIKEATSEIQDVY